ncbi:GntR family transcriptional regulator [Cohnella luojiensis]|uniref:GntR family transcriptional regulator n=1 Tax=Cohnella luojiensis TaxID=652876 RepID=A0A4Y8LYX7_9BACL|nr:GntR family transcriptional regulator [Cohnella luojiensis]TFE25194.1 GntR family transcriptional regulator [Cohnella luojiensis]
MLKGDSPLYQQIIEILRDRIARGEYIPNQQLPTEVELAEQFDVSRITSKRALIELEREGLIYRRRGSGSFVKKRDIARATEEQAAVSSSRIISMIIPYVASNNMLGYYPGVADYLESKGYYLSIHNSDWSSEQERELLRSLPKRGTSGILLYPVSNQHNLDIVHSLQLNDFPIVTIDQYYSFLTMGSVVSDNYKGGYMAATKLIELGHTRIAFLSTIGIQYRSTVRDRFFGYSKALTDNGIPLDIELIFSDLPPEAEGEPLSRRAYYKMLLNKMLELEVTAIQAEHDVVALDCIKAALDMNIKIPEELSVVGFDNNEEISLQTSIPITTIEQDYQEIGRQSAIMIIEQLESGKRQQTRHEIPVKWIDRQSVGPGPELHNLID